MTGFRLWVEFGVCCTLSVLSMHWVPSSYKIHQSYELTGNLEPEMSQRLESKIRKLFLNSKLPQVQADNLECSAATSPHRYQCSTRTVKKSQAQKILNLFKEVIPSRVGWIPKEVLKSRLAHTQDEVDLWIRETGKIETEITELEPQLPSTLKVVEEEQKKRRALFNELETRKKQQEVLSEGIQNRPYGKNRERFETKIQEVSQIIRKLESELQASDQTILKISKPLRRHEELTQALPKLRSQIDLAHAKIISWQTILLKSSKATVIADPEGFQLAAIETPTPILPLRNWTHLPWSIPLGLFIFSLLRGKTLSTWRDQYFHSAQEVQKETGLRFLGEA